MPNQVEDTNINVASYVDATSRYLSSRVIYYSGPDDKKVLTFNTYKRQQPRLSINDKFTVVTAATQYRPDLISNTIYGFPHYWWKIMEFNGINDILDFKAGITIRLPEFI
jgi:hypothetical protein